MKEWIEVVLSWDYIIYRNNDWVAKPQPKLVSSGVENRTKELLNKYGHEYYLWERLANAHWIKAEVIVAIAFADTHLWYATKTEFNIGNVGNTDSGRVRKPDTLEQWISAMFYALNNKYLWEKQTIWDLSYAWWCKIRCDKVYATSNSNRQNNVLNTLSNIYQKKITEDFKFRK